MKKQQLVVFVLDQQQYALKLSAAERAIHAVEITPLPKSPEAVAGMINVRGQVLPVFSVRRRFRLPDRELLPEDQFIIAMAKRRRVALWVDEVRGVIECDAEAVTAMADIAPGTTDLAGVVKVADGLTLIHDLDLFLSLDEEAVLDQALREQA